MPKAASKTSRLVLAMAILVSCVGCDQMTKSIATNSLRNAAAQSFFGDTIRLEYALNPGGFLSFGANLPSIARSWLFIGFNSIFMLLVVGMLMFRWDGRLVVFMSLVFILAGGAGNLIDRVTQNGLVTDFINVGIGPIRSGIFNVADVAVTLGAIVLLVFMRE